jgi:hypothetical protein
VHEVEALVRSGRLAEDDGGRLVELAQRAIDGLTAAGPP